MVETPFVVVFSSFGARRIADSVLLISLSGSRRKGCVPRTRTRSISTRAIVVRAPLRADQQGRVVENGRARANSSAGLTTKQVGLAANHDGLRQKPVRQVDTRRRELGPTEDESGETLSGRRFERALQRFDEGMRDTAGGACAADPHLRALRPTYRATKLHYLTVNPRSEPADLRRDWHDLGAQTARHSRPLGGSPSSADQQVGPNDPHSGSANGPDASGPGTGDPIFRDL